jgi:hypothetical protein
MQPPTIYIKPPKQRSTSRDGVQQFSHSHVSKGRRKNRIYSKYEELDFKTNLILGEATESSTNKKTHGRIDYMTLEMIETNRDAGSVSELSLKMGVKSPKTKIKERN